MAITQKHKVEFTVKSVVPTADVDALIEHIKGAAKAVINGADSYKGYPLDERQKHIIELFVTGGMEDVLSFMVRDALRDAIKGLTDGYGDGHFLTVAPAKIRKVSQ